MDILKEFPKKSLQKRLQRKHNFLALSEKSESEVKVAWSCPTPCNPMDYTVHGLLQARILEWVAIPFSRGSSQPRDQTLVSLIASGFFTSRATKKPCTVGEV